jgi:DNA-nicking Smr family endonuclease
MSEKDDITPEERALFRDSVKGTTPLGDHRPTALSDEKSLQKVQNKPAQSAKIKPTPPKITPLEDFPLSDHSPQPVSGE